MKRKRDEREAAKAAKEAAKATAKDGEGADVDPAEAAKEAEKIAGQASATKVKRARNGSGSARRQAGERRAKNGSRSKPRAKKLDPLLGGGDRPAACGGAGREPAAARPSRAMPPAHSRALRVDGDEQDRVGLAAVRRVAALGGGGDRVRGAVAEDRIASLTADCGPVGRSGSRGGGGWRRGCRGRDGRGSRRGGRGAGARSAVMGGLSLPSAAADDQEHDDDHGDDERRRRRRVGPSGGRGFPAGGQAWRRSPSRRSRSRPLAQPPPSGASAFCALFARAGAFLGDAGFFAAGLGGRRRTVAHPGSYAHSGSYVRPRAYAHFGPYERPLAYAPPRRALRSLERFAGALFGAAALGRARARSRARLLRGCAWVPIIKERRASGAACGAHSRGEPGTARHHRPAPCPARYGRPRVVRACSAWWRWGQPDLGSGALLARLRRRPPGHRSPPPSSGAPPPSSVSGAGVSGVSHI